MPKYTKQCANCLNQGKNVTIRTFNGAIACDCNVIKTIEEGDKARRGILEDDGSIIMYNIMEYIDPTSCPFWRGGN